MTRNIRFRRPIMKFHDVRDIDPFRGNIEALERAEKAYDEKMAQEKADVERSASLGSLNQRAESSDNRLRVAAATGAPRDTRPTTAVTKEMVERSAALNSTSIEIPHSVETESRNTTQGEAMASTPSILPISMPQEFRATDERYQAQVAYIRALTPSVMSDAECEELRRHIKAEVDRRTKFWAPIKKKAFEAHREVCAGETQSLAALLACDDACRVKIGEHARLQRQQAEKERLRLEALERQRRADEAKERALALINQAADADAAGDTNQAEMLMAEAQRVELTPIALVVLPPVEIAKPSGSVVVVKKRADMSKLDKVALLMHCLGLVGVVEIRGVGMTKPNESLIAEILEFKEGAINKLLNKGVNLPGVAFYEVDETRSKGR